jgi:type II secretory pathway pseudopilin PulG
MINGRFFHLKVLVLSDERGFTIIEMMMVVMILMTVVAMGVVSTQHVRNRALLALFYEDIRRTKEAAQMFVQDCGFMPPDAWRGVDPSLAEQNGFEKGNHSAVWDKLDLSCWRGPYMEEWKRNPWGGLYDWDNYPASYSAWGIPGGGCYLTLKPATWGGKDGLPSAQFEDILEEQGVDRSSQRGVVAVWMGSEPDYGVSGQ